MPTASELEVKNFRKRAEPIAQTLDKFEIRVFENEKAVVISKDKCIDSNKSLNGKILDIAAEIIDQYFGTQNEYYVQDITDSSKDTMFAIRVMCTPEYITRWRNILKFLEKEYPKYGYPRFRRILDDDRQLLDELRYATAKVSKRYGVYIKHEREVKFLFHKDIQDLPEELLQEEFESTLRNAFDTSKDSMLFSLLEDLEKLPFRVKDSIRYQLGELQKGIPEEFDDNTFHLEEDIFLINDLEYLKNQLMKLTDQQRKVIELLYFKGFNKTEAAKELKISVTRISQLEVAAKKNLKKEMNEL